MKITLEQFEKDMKVSKEFHEQVIEFCKNYCINKSLTEKQAILSMTYIAMNFIISNFKFMEQTDKSNSIEFLISVIYKIIKECDLKLEIITESPTSSTH